ncbi:Eco57I restriction-modification methylase domain-containing protein [Haloarchaeobius sp. HRN-SO-5]|uniref:Eco57I restriction-modification methylase domain-containing protein n=1 Tax=Haloarchaeobius sp. HRN-SO-5 TaxID=3446118 RepID=UPI003EBF09C9
MVPSDPHAHALSPDVTAARRLLTEDADTADPEATVLRLFVLRVADARDRLDHPVEWSTTAGLADRVATAWATITDRVPVATLPADDWPADASLAAAVGQLETVGDTGVARSFETLDPRHVGTVYEAMLAEDRKPSGAYYTPFPVVRYVVETTVDPLLDAVETGERPVTDLAVLDPATGCGRFLVDTVLVCRDRLAGTTQTVSGTLTDALVSNCLYGVDLDARALDLTTLVTWLTTGASADALASLHDHLHEGDALVGRASVDDSPVCDPPTDGPAVDWPEAFPEIRGEDRRFDAAVGNPPYVRSRSIPDDRKADYRESYATAVGAFDLYVPFLERTSTLADRIGVVVPNKWTTTRYGRPLRDRLLDDHRVAELVDLSSLDVFDDAAVYPLVLRFQANAGPTDELTVTHPRKAADIDDAPHAALPRDVVDGLGDRVIPTDVDADAAGFVARLAATGSRLGDHATATEGIHTGNVREKLVVDEPTPDAVPVVGGDSVEPYLVDWDGRYVRTDPELVDEAAGEYADLREPSLFAGPKLLAPDVARWPTVAYDTEGRHALNTLYVVRPREETPYGVWHLLGLLNSTLVRWYFTQVYGGTHVSGGYLRCKPMFLLELPVPPSPDPADLDRLARAARTARDARADRDALEPDLSPSFEDPDGATLADHGATVVADGPLTATTEEYPNLRLGDVAVEQHDGVVELRATARYKPDGEPAAPVEDGGSSSASERERDRWGYVETPAAPALRLECGDRLAGLVAAFVPEVVERDDGTAGFRCRAAKSIAPVDRLRSIRLPDPDAVADELDDYRRARDCAARLDETIEATDRRIDEVVADLYGATDADRTLLDAWTGG